MQHCLSAADRPEPRKPKIKVMIRLLGVCALKCSTACITLEYLFSSVESIHKKLSTPPHSVHCAECGGMLGLVRLQAVLEKRYSQVSRKRDGRNEELRTVFTLPRVQHALPSVVKVIGTSEDRAGARADLRPFVVVLL
jgi:hypothetical protein